jgi:Flp pilus assembly pilin Flp
MTHYISRIWQEEHGFIISVELTLIATIAVIGLLAGMSSVRDAVVSELSDVAGAVQDLNQSYMLFGITGHSASTAGMDYLDQTDFCDSDDDAAGAFDNCITVSRPTAEGTPASAPTGS